MNIENVGRGTIEEETQMGGANEPAGDGGEQQGRAFQALGFRDGE